MYRSTRDQIQGLVDTWLFHSSSSAVYTHTDRQANLSKISWLNCAKHTQWYCLPGMEGQVTAQPTTAHRLQRYLYYDLWCTVVERMGWGRREGWWTDYPMQMRAPVIIQELISRITYWLDHLKGIILHTKPNWTVLILWSNVTQEITINFDVYIWRDWRPLPENRVLFFIKYDQSQVPNFVVL